MPARFCPQCGTHVEPHARFCSECGTPLGGAPPRRDGGWRFTATGAALLGFFLLAGLSIWTLILSPATPKPGPGMAARPPAPPAASSTEVPGGHPPIALPEEVKRFVAELAARAKQQPKDSQTWLRLALVNARAAQLDPAYSDDALAAFRHVLELEPRNTDALQGLANLHYDRSEAAEAITQYERYLELRPEDEGARTDLGTMYLQAGDAARAVRTYQDVIRRNPSFLQAHYNLAITHHRQGDDRAALAELEVARRLATDDRARRQIDEMVATIKGEAPPSDGGRAAPAPATAPMAAPGTPFQQAVEEAFRGHPIMGPRIVRFHWTAAGSGRVVVRDFPMEGMPPAVREKFTGRLAEALRTAATAHPVDGPVRMEIADLPTGRVMETITQ